MDASLHTLVPLRSPLRSLVVIVLMAVALVGALLAPGVLRPELVSYSGMATPLEETNQVLTSISLEPSDSASGTIVAVSPVPGAEPSTVWILERLAQEFDGLGGGEALPLDRQLAVNYHVEELDGARLPQPIPNGSPHTSFIPDGQPELVDDETPPEDFFTGEGRYDLVILWDIVDCSRLVDFAPPVVELRTVIGTTTLHQLDDFANPGFLFSLEDDQGLCD